MNFVGFKAIQFSFQIEVTEEYELYDFTDFLSDVGGYFGLLLGASLLSMIEDTFDFFEDQYSKRSLIAPTSPSMPVNQNWVFRASQKFASYFKIYLINPVWSKSKPKSHTRLALW